MEISDDKSLELFKKNKNLVHFAVNKYFKKTKNILYDYDDLCQLGFIGLWKACKTFDETKNIKFSTYAIKVIYNEIGYNLRTLKNDLYPVYLYEPLNEENDEFLIDTLKTYDDTNYKLLIIKINDILNDSLNNADRVILKCKIEGMSQTKIAKILGCSQAQISRKIKKLYNEITKGE